MLVRATIERALRVQSLVDVVETLAVRCKGKSAQVPAGEKVGETSSSFDFEQLEGPGPLSPFLYFIQEQSTVGRNTKWFYGGVLARSPFGGIDQKLILAVCTLTHANGRLLLVGKALSEKVAAANLLQGVIGFDGEEFADTLTDALAPGNAVKVCASVASLISNPSSGARRILLFEPAIGVGDRNPMENVRHR